MVYLIYAGFFGIKPYSSLRETLRIPLRNSTRTQIYDRFSKMPAAPMPPPTHMVTMPYLELRRFIS